MRRSLSRSVTWLVLLALTLAGCGAGPITQKRLDTCQPDAGVRRALERLSVKDTRLLRLEDGRFVELTISRIADDVLEGSGREIVRQDDVYVRLDAEPMVMPRSDIVAVCATPRGYKPTPWALAGVAALVVALVLLYEALEPLKDWSHID